MLKCGYLKGFKISLINMREVSMAMMNENVIARDAMYLLDKMNTIWIDYDFDETSQLFETKVPRIRFDTNVTIALDEVELFHCPYAKYIREVQLEYNDNIYIFEVLPCICDGVVTSYIVDVFTPAGDGVGGKKYIISERI